MCSWIIVISSYILSQAQDIRVDKNDRQVGVGIIHHSDVIMTIASQITSLTIVYSPVYSDADKKKSKLRVNGHCAGNSPVTGEFPAQIACNTENVSIWWRHHVQINFPA